MKRIAVCTALLLLSMGVSFAERPVTPAGTQVIVARSTNEHVDIDGVLTPAEWSGASVVHVSARPPYGPPGVVPAFVALPDDPRDSSFTIRAMYDDDNIYVAVTVADDVPMNDGPAAWLDDDVEIFIDGDRQPGDVDAGVFMGQPNNEGFQLITSLGNERVTEPSPGFRRPEPGDAIGFNIAVGDDDGGVAYDHPNGFLAWDGSRSDSLTFDETAWGILYLDPRTRHGGGSSGHDSIDFDRTP